MQSNNNPRIYKKKIPEKNVSGEYLTRYVKGSVVKMDPYSYLVKYFLGVLKKNAKVLDIVNTNI